MGGRDVLPATAKQKLYITRLAVKLGDKTNFECQAMTMGEAGKTISTLKRRLAIEKAKKNYARQRRAG